MGAAGGRAPAHRATGAFVTHCGWNSVREGITAGVPLLCWPLYAEQRLNKVFMVEEARVGVEMAGYDREVVAADSEDGRRLRGRAMAANERPWRLCSKVARHTTLCSSCWGDLEGFDSCFVSFFLSCKFSKLPFK